MLSLRIRRRVLHQRAVARAIRKARIATVTDVRRALRHRGRSPSANVPRLANAKRTTKNVLIPRTPVKNTVLVRARIAKAERDAVR
jgi:hypothetical protein